MRSAAAADSTRPRSPFLVHRRQAPQEPFISPNISESDSVIRAGYLLEMEAAPFPGSPASCNGMGAGESGLGFAAAADPLEPNMTRFFAINANGQIWEHTSSMYATIPEVGDSLVGQPLQ